MHDADEDADLAARAQSCGRIAGILDARIGGFEEQAFLRVHALRLAGRNLEEEGIELVHIVEESTPPAIARAGFPFFLVIEPAPVPAIRRNFADTVGASPQTLPEFSHIPGSGVTPTQANDGDVLHGEDRALGEGSYTGCALVSPLRA